MHWVAPQCLHWGLGVRREGHPLADLFFADAVCADPSSTLKELGAGPSAGEGVGRCVAPWTLRSGQLGASAWKEEGPDCGRGGVRPPWGGHRPPQRGPRMGFRGGPKRRKLDWSSHPTIPSRIPWVTWQWTQASRYTHPSRGFTRNRHTEKTAFFRQFFSWPCSRTCSSRSRRKRVPNPSPQGSGLWKHASRVPCPAQLVPTPGCGSRGAVTRRGSLGSQGSGLEGREQRRTRSGTWGPL